VQQRDLVKGKRRRVGVRSLGNQASEDGVDVWPGGGSNRVQLVFKGFGGSAMRGARGGENQKRKSPIPPIWFRTLSVASLRHRNLGVVI
jgi:hypothetical protein